MAQRSGRSTSTAVTQSRHINRIIGCFDTRGVAPSSGLEVLADLIGDLGKPLCIVENEGRYEVATVGVASLGTEECPSEGLPLVAYLPPCRLEDMGDRAFLDDHGIRYPCIAGSMANGIASVDIVQAMGRAGMLGFFGAAGLSYADVEAAVDKLHDGLGDLPYGCNLIHSPNEPELEASIVDLYIRRGVRLAEASAYLKLTLPVARYRVHGIYRNSEGDIITPNKLIAKVSRIEVASHFFSPPPENILRELVTAGDITEEQAELASQIPMAQDLTAEADSGGHTDNRPAITLIPIILALRDEVQKKYGYRQKLRVGAAGGIATPASAAAVFAMGAAYVMTGSINQSSIESGTSDQVRGMLAEASQADTIMAPAADMFEMGVKVQVLKRGTMFAMKAAKLYEFYKAYESIEEIPEKERMALEKNYFRTTLEDIWEQTRKHFRERDLSQLERAESNPKYKMALIFRWYLGMASRWANSGEESRTIDYQIWCGPAMGAFNEWIKGSFLEQSSNRHVAVMALNILYGAAIINRLNVLRFRGITLPDNMSHIRPFTPEQLEERIS